MRGFFLKNLDEEIYRAIKAIAARRGVPVYRVVNEALSLYVNLHCGLTTETEEGANNRVYESLLRDPRYRGKWVAIARGRLIAVADTWEEAVQKMRDFVRRERVAHGVVVRVGEEAERVKIFSSSLEML